MAILDETDFGVRDTPSNRKRALALLALLILIVVLELTLGERLQQEVVADLVWSSDNWARAYFTEPESKKRIPPKNAGRLRLVYVSNSHAMTGGQVTRHLQALADSLAPGSLEVIDLSQPGIFAPEMLQRTLLSLDFHPDLVVLAVSYISFSDRMDLGLQAHSARSFFKPGVFERLPAGFWARNYDIGIYANTLVSHFSAMYRFRNRLRNGWEVPLASAIKAASGARRIFFLEADENQRWRFPDGYDNNLFQWNLYASGRKNQVQGMADLVRILDEQAVPLIAVNLPIDLGKTVYPYDLEDFARYRETMAAIFSAADHYIDQDSYFPKKFTTYDALHPTWHGARLHALDLLLHLHQWQMIGRGFSSNEIATVFNDSDQGVSAAYQRLLNGDYPPPDRYAFRRYDPSDPSNARALLRRLAGTQVASRAEAQILRDLSLRIRYWTQTEFPVPPTPEPFAAAWQEAVRQTISQARERMSLFADRLGDFQRRRLAGFPLPELDPADQRQVTEVSSPEIPDTVRRYYALEDGRRVLTYETSDERRYAIVVFDPAQDRGYQRTDLLGDGSFLLLAPVSNGAPVQVWMPAWAIGKPPASKWGS